MSDQLELDVHEAIATITLNRPERLNAFTMEMIDAWAAALGECRVNDAVRAVVVTGAGRAFCSGGDVDMLRELRGAASPARKAELWEHIHRVPLALEDLSKPVIVAVNGPATGAGMDMALMGDIRFAAESARFAETYIKIGLVPGDGGSYYLPRLVGTAKALELFWSGDFVDANEALRLGIVNRVVPDAELMETTYAFAGKVARAPRHAVEMTKRAVYQSMRLDLRTSLDLISSHYGVVTATEEHKTKLETFLKRSEERG